MQAEKVPEPPRRRAGDEAARRRVGTRRGTQFTARDPRADGIWPAGWVVGGYLSDWAGVTRPAVLADSFTVVLDHTDNVIARAADVFLPAAAWCEKDGTWENHAGVLQQFRAAVAPPAGAVSEGNVFVKLLGRDGKYDAAKVRAELAEKDDAFADGEIDQPEKETFAEDEAFEFVEI